MQVFFKAGDGYSDVYGVAWPLREDTKQRSAEDIEVARARAAKDLVNIDSDERRRRVIFGSILTATIVTIMVIAAKLHAHPLERVWLLLPFFIGAAEIASGAGVWDVDGTGMQAVDDPEVDLGIRKKLIGFVSAGAIGTLFVMVPYILWPF
ncbi:g11217 [Coccomyxa viridis]|uniref:G11217 protein n=1 Tax=Coccomyxa viridis TaxID=1274662 RepID=A0ABP1GBU9_9CHLO